jgi:hypothetical protein
LAALLFSSVFSNQLLRVTIDRKGVLGGEEEVGGVRSGPGEARTILLLHIISVRPSKQPLMVRTFLKVVTKVYIELGSYFFVSARTNKRHHHHHTVNIIYAVMETLKTRI